MSFQTLIEQKFLARPIPVRVETQADVEAGVRLQDQQYFASFKELSKEWLGRIAPLSQSRSGKEVKTIFVYKHQQFCWKELIHLLWKLPESSLKLVRPDVKPEELWDKFFVDYAPLPAPYNLQKLFKHFLAGGERPKYKRMVEGELFDPKEIALKIWSDDLSERAKSQLIKDRYTELVQATYPVFRDFCGAIEDALYELRISA